MARKQTFSKIVVETPRAKCGWTNCMADALPRMKTPRGWLDLCLSHYDDYWRWIPLSQSDPNGWLDERQMAATRVGYRERWYAEHNLPYEPPRLGDSPPFKCVGRLAPEIRQREPGDDDEEIARS